MKGFDFMTAREKILTLAEGIADLYNTIYETDMDGFVHFTDEFKNSIPADDVDEYYKLQNELAHLTKENEKLFVQLKAKSTLISHYETEILSLKRKLSKALTENVKMCEHIKELHKNDNSPL